MATGTRCVVARRLKATLLSRTLKAGSAPKLNGWLLVAIRNELTTSAKKPLRDGRPVVLGGHRPAPAQ